MEKARNTKTVSEDPRLRNIVNIELFRSCVYLMRMGSTGILNLFYFKIFTMIALWCGKYLFEKILFLLVKTRFLFTYFSPTGNTILLSFENFILIIK